MKISRVICYNKFLEIQKYISIENIKQVKFEYNDLKITISFAPIKETKKLTLEEFICMAWKKDFYNEDKFYYSKFSRQKNDSEIGLIEECDVGNKYDFVFNIKAKDVRAIINNFIKKDYIGKIKIAYESINDCYILSSKKDYIFEDFKSVPTDGINIIFNDNTYTYMIEICIDC